MDKAKLYEPGKESQAIMVQFNPNTLEYSIKSNRNNGKGTQSKASDSAAREEVLQRDPTGGGDRAVLSVRLFYHTYSNSTTYTDVRDEIKKIQQFVRYSGNTAGGSDPRITFAWGSLIHTGVMEDFSVSYKMFAADGTPVQAEVSLSICGDEADRAAERANQLTGLKAVVSALAEDAVEDPLADMWAWLYV